MWGTEQKTSITTSNSLKPRQATKFIRVPEYLYSCRLQERNGKEANMH